MTKRRNFTPEFKAEVVLEALSGETSQAELCIESISTDDITSANNSSRSGSSKSLKMWRRCLSPLRISSRARRRSALLTLSSSLGV